MQQPPAAPLKRSRLHEETARYGTVQLRCCASRPILECQKRTCPSPPTVPPRPLSGRRTGNENPARSQVCLPISHSTPCRRPFLLQQNTPPMARNACPSGCVNRSDFCGSWYACILAFWSAARRGIRRPGTPIRCSLRRPGCIPLLRTARFAVWSPALGCSISGSPYATPCAGHPSPASNSGYPVHSIPNRGGRQPEQVNSISVLLKRKRGASS